MTRVLLASLACLTIATICVAASDSPVATLADLDHAPRRIGYAPVAYPAALGENGPDDNVTLEAVFDAKGSCRTVENIVASRPEFAEAARQIVQKWVFEPALVGGKSVAFRLPVTLAFRARQVSDSHAGAGEGGTAAVIPQIATPAYETIPAYPESLAAEPVEGYAMVSVLVDESGNPSDVVTEFATRSEFAAPAAAAVAEWVFTPAMDKGEPAATRTLVTVKFTTESAAWSEIDRTLRAQLQYRTSYDTGPDQLTSVPVVFPYDRLVAGERDTVMLTVLVSPNGLVVQTVGGPGAEPDFVASARASLASWTFKPAIKAGKPVFGVVQMSMRFDEYRDEFRFDPVSFELLEKARAGVDDVLSVKDVDTKPRPTKQVAPVLPRDFDGDAAGKAVVEFIIDRNGHPQLPRIKSATSPEFGWAATVAVMQWEFEPATKGGSPVDCRARVPMNFVPPEKPAS